jgi:phosphoribosylanthranilate isomerase
MYKIKVCGVRSPDIVPVLNKLIPDYVGFILSKGFKRTIDASVATAIRRELAPQIKTVGVFVNEPYDYIIGFLKEGVINVVQLHGDEDVEYIKGLKKLTSAPIIKAVGVVDGRVNPYPKNCDIVLLDACSKTERGGTGRNIIWRRYDEIDKPIILAGGINADNVAEALREVNPYGVDASGGLETDGNKDAAKIEAYIAAVRKAN